MAKPVTDEQRRVWKRVYEEVAALAEYHDRLAPGLGFGAALVGWDEPTQPYATRLSGLRQCRTDLLEASGDLSVDQLRELDAHLRERLGKSFHELDTKRCARIDALRAKGRLTTDEQFRLVSGHVELIWNDPARSEEVADLGRLLMEYEARRKPRGTKGKAMKGRRSVPR